MYNKVILVGNLTKDGESKFLTNGTEVYKNSIATTYKYKTQSGESKQEAMFLDFNCMGGIAKICSQYLKKGSKVLLAGRLVFEQWTAQDGSNRSRHSLRVDEMEMLDSKSDNQGQSNKQPQQRSEPPIVYDNAQNNYPYPEIDIDEDEIPF